MMVRKCIKCGEILECDTSNPKTKYTTCPKCADYKPEREDGMENLKKFIQYFDGLLDCWDEFDEIIKQLFEDEGVHLNDEYLVCVNIAEKIIKQSRR